MSFPIFNPLITNIPLETSILIAVLVAVGTGLILFGVAWLLIHRKKKGIIYIPRKLASQPSQSLTDNNKKGGENK